MSSKSIKSWKTERGVVRWTWNFPGMEYPRVLWVWRVWRPSEHSDSQNSQNLKLLTGRVAETHKCTYNHPRAQNRDFELPRYSRALESSPDGFYLWSSLVLSIQRVSEPSDNFSFQKSGFWEKSWDQCTKYSKTTFNHLRAQNRDSGLPKHFRLLGSPPYGVYLWNSRVQSILKFSEPSD